MRQVQQAYPPLSVRQLSGWLGLSRSWYYARSVGAAAADETELRDAIERIVLDFPGYGYRRVTHALHRSGWPVNHKRVLRVMREEALLCQLKRHFVVTTDSAHRYRTYPNLLVAASLDRLDQAWVADITYIRLYPPADDVCLSGRHVRRVLAALHWLEALAPDRYAPDLGSPGDGA